MTCVNEGMEQFEQQGSLEVTSSGVSSSAHTGTLTADLEQLRSFATLAENSRGGAGLDGQGVLEEVLKMVHDQITGANSVAGYLVMHLCSESDASAAYSLVLHVNTKHRIGIVQQSIHTWKNYSCVETTRKLSREAGWTPPDEHVCCSSGNLLDFSPKPCAEVYCHKYLVKTRDNCVALSASCDLIKRMIEEFKKKTQGCTGYPSMPMNIAIAVCGPQVNDTKEAPPGTNLSTLSQCPLNA
nr:glycosylhydrolase family 18-6 [Colletotrichum truncatum]KAF6781626.1 glycosylhydrolase family 18-6 [Colletotrichum truncatum]